jgi:hypothetical protein
MQNDAIAYTANYSINVSEQATIGRPASSPDFLSDLYPWETLNNKMHCHNLQTSYELKYCICETITAITVSELKVVLNSLDI